MENRPKHLAIILDGNRRYAQKLMLQPWKGHEFGAKKVEQLLDWCNEFGVSELTLYCFSQENFSRSATEFSAILEIFRKEFERLAQDDRLEKYNIKLRFIGHRTLFPMDIQTFMGKLEERTKNNTAFTINFAMAYSGRTEIVDAVKAIAQDVKAGKLDPQKIDESLFASHLYLTSEPDMLIRTSGEKRISTFLLWQLSYSEFFFVDKLWPEFEKEDFAACIEEFKQRKRRFGK